MGTNSRLELADVERVMHAVEPDWKILEDIGISTPASSYFERPDPPRGKFALAVMQREVPCM